MFIALVLAPYVIPVHNSSCVTLMLQVSRIELCARRRREADVLGKAAAMLQQMLALQQLSNFGRERTVH